jgi:hypothetical protein
MTGPELYALLSRVKQSEEARHVPDGSTVYYRLLEALVDRAVILDARVYDLTEEVGKLQREVALLEERDS